MTALDEHGHAQRCAVSTGSGPCMREVSYKVERPFADRIDYVCKGHLSHLVKARLRGASAVTVEKA